MLFLSQTDASGLRTTAKEMYLDDAIAEATRAAKTLARPKQQTVQVRALQEARCCGDQELLRQAILILLENAVKFTPVAGRIEVAMERREAAWACSVIDNGVGIPTLSQPHIFERFYRAEQVQACKVPGSGLGLAIAKAIVEKHNGTLTLIASRPGGTHFEILIPALDDHNSEFPDHANSLAVKI